MFNNYSLIIIAHSTLTAGHRNNKNGSSRSYSNNNIPHQFSNAICHQLHNLQFVVWGLKRVSLLGTGWSTLNTFSAHFAAVRNSSSKLNVIFLFFSLYFRWKLFYWCLLILRLYSVFLNWSRVIWHRRKQLICLILLWITVFNSLKCFENKIENR